MTLKRLSNFTREKEVSRPKQFVWSAFKIILTHNYLVSINWSSSFEREVDLDLVMIELIGKTAVANLFSQNLSKCKNAKSAVIFGARNNRSSVKV